VPPKGPSGLVDQLEFRYVTFPVTNISKICEALKEKGVQFTIPETELMPDADYLNPGNRGGLAGGGH